MNASNHTRSETERCATQDRAEQKVELWLRESLACAYDPVLAERLPDEWLAMIRRMEKR
jgi:hypothetical protein